MIRTRLSTPCALLILPALLYWGTSLAECRASNFDQAKFEQQISAINEAAANLKALQTSPAFHSAPVGQTSMLSLAGVYTDRTATEGVMFNFLVMLWKEMVEPADRAHVDLAIAVQADQLRSSFGQYADYLTTLATVAPLFAGEIRVARDAVRHLEAMFQCAATPSR